MIGKPLEQICFAGADAEMAKLHLRLGPGEGRRPFEGHRIAMLVGEVEDVIAR